MAQKLVFFDIDGTIIDEHTYEIPESTVAAIKKLRANGHLAFINTGRPYSIIEDKIREIGFDGYICSCGTYIRLKDEVFLHKALTPERSLEIVGLARQFYLEVIYEALSGVYFDLTRPLREKSLIYKSRFDSMGIETNMSIDSPDFYFDKFIIWTNNSIDFQHFCSFVEKDFDCIDRGNRLFEFVPKGYSKATGIKLLIDALGSELQNCYAIGDSANDLSMLEYVANSIAMGNSSKALFEKVSFVTKRLEDDGVEYALKHFKLI